ATGGALALLYHQKLGPLFTASLAKYLLVEPNNMQPLPDKLDFPLTPRVESQQGDQWFTNLYDLSAKIAWRQQPDGVQFQVQTRLVDEKQREPDGAMAFQLTYELTTERVTIRVEPAAGVRGKWS